MNLLHQTVAVTGGVVIVIAAPKEFTIIALGASFAITGIAGLLSHIAGKLP